MKMVRSRTCLAVFTAYAILLVFAAESLPSYDTEAGRKYDIACQRASDLKKSKKRQRFRSYWMDCIRTFEMVEKKYPRSERAGDACVERAGLYLDLYGISKYARDKNESMKVYTSCQAAYPRHARAPEALFRMMEIHLDQNRDQKSAGRTYAKLSQDYPDSEWTGRAKARLVPAAAPAKKQPELRNAPGTPPKSAPKPAAPAAPAQLGTVNSIRQWSSESYTRIVIDLDRPLRKLPDPHEFKDPDRLVFDLPGFRMGESLSKDPLVLNNGILRQVRSSQYAPDTVRVVLDLASIKSYAAFPLSDPSRLVIDVNGEPAEGGEQPALPAPAGQGAAKPPATVVVPPVHPPAVPKDDSDSLSLSRQMGLKIRTVAIDAGHGGHDPGAIGRSGLKEKVITLDVARRLAAMVKEKLNCNVIMTRDKDVFIPLEERPFIAKSKGADLFVSIHVNANRKRTAKGIETYIQSLTASDRDAMATAARENAMSTKKLSELKSELDRIFADLQRDDKLEESLHLAHAVQGSLVNTMKPAQGHVVNLGVKRAFFYVLINTEMPSILAEVGFISNQEEEKMLRKESYRQKIADALFQGIKRYVDARNPQVMGI